MNKLIYSKTDLPYQKIFGKTLNDDGGYASSKYRKVIFAPASATVGGFSILEQSYCSSTLISRGIGELPLFNPTQFSLLKDISPSIVLEKAIYGGVLWDHYGHFLLETLSRLCDESVFLDSTVPIIFHGQANTLSLAWVNKILSAINISPDRVIIIDKPILIEELIVCWPLFKIRYKASIEFLASTSKIGKKITLNNGSTSGNKKIYLSRTRLALQTRQIEGECIIEQEFKKRDFTIVHPELMSLEDQILAFNEATTIAGCLGSSFHTLLFARQNKNIIYISLGKMVNSNFVLIDKLRQDNSEYWLLNDCSNTYLKKGENYIVNSDNFKKMY